MTSPAVYMAARACSVYHRSTCCMCTFRAWSVHSWVFLRRLLRQSFRNQTSHNYVARARSTSLWQAKVNNWSRIRIKLTVSKADYWLWLAYVPILNWLIRSIQATLRMLKSVKPSGYGLRITDYGLLITVSGLLITVSGLLIRYALPGLITLVRQH